MERILKVLNEIDNKNDDRNIYIVDQSTPFVITDYTIKGGYINSDSVVLEVDYGEECIKLSDPVIQSQLYTGKNLILLEEGKKIDFVVRKSSSPVENIVIYLREKEWF